MKMRMMLMMHGTIIHKIMKENDLNIDNDDGINDWDEVTCGSGDVGGINGEDDNDDDDDDDDDVLLTSMMVTMRSVVLVTTKTIRHDGKDHER